MHSAAAVTASSPAASDLPAALTAAESSAPPPPPPPPAAALQAGSVEALLLARLAEQAAELAERKTAIAELVRRNEELSLLAAPRAELGAAPPAVSAVVLDGEELVKEAASSVVPRGRSVMPGVVTASNAVSAAAAAAEVAVALLSPPQLQVYPQAVTPAELRATERERVFLAAAPLSVPVLSLLWRAACAFGDEAGEGMDEEASYERAPAPLPTAAATEAKTEAEPAATTIPAGQPASSEPATSPAPAPMPAPPAAPALAPTSPLLSAEDANAFHDLILTQRREILQLREQLERARQESRTASGRRGSDAKSASALGDVDSVPFPAQALSPTSSPPPQPLPPPPPQQQQLQQQHQPRRWGDPYSELPRGSPPVLLLQPPALWGELPRELPRSPPLALAEAPRNSALLQNLRERLVTDIVSLKFHVLGTITDNGAGNIWPPSALLASPVAPPRSAPHAALTQRRTPHAALADIARPRLPGSAGGGSGSLGLDPGSLDLYSPGGRPKGGVGRW